MQGHVSVLGHSIPDILRTIEQTASCCRVLISCCCDHHTELFLQFKLLSFCFRSLADIRHLFSYGLNGVNIILFPTGVLIEIGYLLSQF